MEVEKLFDREKAQERLREAISRRLTPVGINENGELCYLVEDLLRLLGPPIAFRMRSEDAKSKRKQGPTLH